MRLIDADELLKNEFKNDISFNAFQNLVKRQKTIDAVPVMHGEWKKGIHTAECSCCFGIFDFGIETWVEDFDIYDDLGLKYCPNCGAKMDGKE